jgi:hypothetical protein
MKQSKNSNQPRAVAKINSKLNQNLASYMTAAGAAGVAMLALTHTAAAKVIYTPTYVQLGGNYFPDINHDGVYDFAFRPYGFCISERVGSLCGGSINLNLSSYSKGKFMGAANGFASALHAGDKIGPPGQFSARQIIAMNFYQFFSGTVNPPNWFGPFANGGKGVRDRYIGLKFNIGPEAHYGWMRISVNIPNAEKNGYSAIVTGYAYETEPNKGIVAGATSGTDEKSALNPVPLAPHSAASMTLGMLARGADGLAFWRREDDTVAR